MKKEKCCPNCKLTKLLSEFTKDAKTKDGLFSLCRDCKKASSKKYQASKKGQKTLRKGHLRRKFEMTIEDYDFLLKSQGGVCAICRTKENRDKRAKVFTIDHSHKTGKVRGVLCNPCNALLGLAQDDPKILNSAKRYLRGFRIQSL